MISDAFTRADSSNLGANWAEDSGDWEITSNTARQQTAGSSYRKLRWAGTALASNNYYVQAVGKASDSIYGFGVFGRGAASSTVTFYAIIGFGGDAFYLVEITAGGETIHDTGSACVAGTQYTLRLECNGSSIKGYVNGVEDVAVTDATLASGAVGIVSFGTLDGTNDWIDSFEADDLAGAAVPRHPAIIYNDPGVV